MLKKQISFYALVFTCAAASSCYAMELELPDNSLGAIDVAQSIKEEPIMKKEQGMTQDMVNIGLDAETRNKSVQKLHALLANEYVLYVKTQKFHWNVKGPFFGALHKLFNDQYEQLAEFVDAIAERCLSLGLPSTGTLKEFLSKTTLQEEPGVNPSYEAMIAQLLVDHETVIRQLREAADDTQKWNDMGTNNFLLNLLEKHEKTAWMLRAHLQK